MSIDTLAGTLVDTLVTKTWSKETMETSLTYINMWKHDMGLEKENINSTLQGRQIWRATVIQGTHSTQQVSNTH